MSKDLIIVGSGIKAGAHFTLEATGWIKAADRVLYLVADPATEHHIKTMSAQCESLSDCYNDGESRSLAYERMVQRAIGALESSDVVCVVFYGHPGVFVYPSFKMAEEARALGARAIMLPGISADSCIYADLEFDPARDGCQSFEATDFVLQRRIHDPRSVLILWQIGMLGDGSFQVKGYNNRNLTVLVNILLSKYHKRHPVIVYEASQYALCDPLIHRCLLSELYQAPITPISTLVIPPSSREPVSISALNELGLDKADIIVESPEH